MLLARPYTYLADTRRRLNEAEATLEDLYERVKSLHGRKAQAARRERAEEDSTTAQQLPGESPMEWKRRVRKLMNQGQLKLSHGRE